MTTGFPFKRLLLKLPLRFSDRAVIDTAATFAERLKLSLIAELIEGAELDWLAEIPGLRELRALSNEWHPIDRVRWREELVYSENCLRGIFESATSNRVLTATFCATRAAMPLALSDVGSEDIIAIPQPTPIDIISQQLDDLSRAAFGTPAAVMFVPPSSGPGTGPVAVIAGSSRDPGISVGLAIAAANRQDFILVPTSRFRDSVEPSQADAVGAGVRMLIGEAVDPDAGIMRALVHVARYNASMLVTARGHSGWDILRPSENVNAQRIAVLILDGDQER